MLGALGGRRIHLAHLQYYCYGKTKRAAYQSQVDRMLTRLADMPLATADLGLIDFGEAFTATADLPLEHALYRSMGSPARPALFCDCENEDGFGVMPLDRSASNPVHALQWATGLELALKWDNPWQCVLSVDHPNGGSFTNYPSLIAALMNKPHRDEQLNAMHKAGVQHTDLASVKREMTLYDIAIITRAAPAKALGLDHKGHLGDGADADITIYDNNPADPKRMFESPRCVIKGGIDARTSSSRLLVDIPQDPKGESLLNQWFSNQGSFDVSQYGARH
jgi:formylmethanofuran dehydrogenase subunit A